jgi:hypothetical protein
MLTMDYDEILLLRHGYCLIPVLVLVLGRVKGIGMGMRYELWRWQWPTETSKGLIMP